MSINFLAIDPSLSRCGVALYRNGMLADFGAYIPKGSGVIDRVYNTADYLKGPLFGEQAPRRVAIEIPDGHSNDRHKGGGAGLPLYGGFAFGLTIVLMERGWDVHPIPVNVWTQSRSKAKRTKMIGLKHPEYARRYAVRGDADMDIADAIGIGDWWMTEQIMKGAK